MTLNTILMTGSASALISGSAIAQVALATCADVQMTTEMPTEETGCEADLYLNQ